MSIRIVIAEKVGFKVEGAYNDADGVKVPFDFTVVARRLPAEALDAATREEKSIEDFLVDVAEDWRGVKDEEGNVLQYSPAALRQLFQIPGLARLTFAGYFANVGAKAKN